MPQQNESPPVIPRSSVSFATTLVTALRSASTLMLAAISSSAATTQGDGYLMTAMNKMAFRQVEVFKEEKVGGSTTVAALVTALRSVSTLMLAATASSAATSPVTARSLIRWQMREPKGAEHESPSKKLIVLCLKETVSKKVELEAELNKLRSNVAEQRAKFEAIRSASDSHPLPYSNHIDVKADPPSPEVPESPSKKLIVLWLKETVSKKVKLEAELNELRSNRR
ncbi:hypothetical protein HDK77DRAFT_478018 [Phyllosticta capitalensis]